MVVVGIVVVVILSFIDTASPRRVKNRKNQYQLLLTKASDRSILVMFY